MENKFINDDPRLYKQNNDNISFQMNEILESIRQVISSGEKKESFDDSVIELTQIVNDHGRVVTDDKTVNNDKEKKISLNNNDNLIAHALEKKVKQAINDAIKITNDTKSIDMRAAVTEAIVPMLREWLDKNLYQLVQDVIREEIKRIIPK